MSQRNKYYTKIEDKIVNNGNNLYSNASNTEKDKYPKKGELQNKTKYIHGYSKSSLTKKITRDTTPEIYAKNQIGEKPPYFLSTTNKSKTKANALNTNTSKLIQDKTNKQANEKEDKANRNNTNFSKKIGSNQFIFEEDFSRPGNKISNIKNSHIPNIRENQYLIKDNKEQKKDNVDYSDKEPITKNMQQRGLLEFSDEDEDSDENNDEAFFIPLFTIEIKQKQLVSIHYQLPNINNNIKITKTILFPKPSKENILYYKCKITGKVEEPNDEYFIYTPQYGNFKIIFRLPQTIFGDLHPKEFIPRVINNRNIVEFYIKN